MIKELPWRLIFVLILLPLGVSLNAGEQETIQVDHADQLQQREIEGQTLRILTGNVQLQQDDITLKCDSAVQYIQQNEIEAWDNVHIKHGDSLHLYGDHLFYDGNKREAVMEGNVKMEEEDMTLKTERLFYEVDEGKAYYRDKARILEGKNKLTSKTGYYFSENKNLEFKDSVRLDNPDFLLKSDTLHYHHPTSVATVHGPTRIDRKASRDYLYCERGWYNTDEGRARAYKNPYLWYEGSYLEADTLYLEEATGYAEAKGNIHLNDTSENTSVYGHYAEYFDDRQYTYITDSASARSIMEEDTLYLSADTLIAKEDDTGEHSLFKAHHNVRSYHEDFQTDSDSLVYREKDSMLTLYNEPKAWLDSQQISADTIRAKFDGENIETMFLEGQAFLISPVGHDFYNQIKGLSMKGHFSNNELRRIEVSGNAEGIYFLKDEEERFVGVNRIEASEISIEVVERQLNEITFSRSPDANVYPMGRFDPGELILAGFRWNPQKMPLLPKGIFKDQNKLP